MFGLNILFSVLRRSEAIDSVGGAVYTSNTLVSGVRGRLGNASRSSQMALHDEGYESLRAYQIVAQPSDLNVIENDLVLIAGGQYAGYQFLVRSVRRDNLPATDGRSHVELLVERLVAARSTP